MFTLQCLGMYLWPLLWVIWLDHKKSLNENKLNYFAKPRSDGPLLHGFNWSSFVLQTNVIRNFWCRTSDLCTSRRTSAQCFHSRWNNFFDATFSRIFLDRTDIRNVSNLIIFDEPFNSTTKSVWRTCALWLIYLCRPVINKQQNQDQFGF